MLFFLFLFHLVNNIHVLHLDNTPYVYDMANLRLQSINYFESFKSGNFKKIIKDYNNPGFFYPPLLMLVPIPLYVLFGTNQDITSLSNMIYFLILLFSVFFIGKKIKNEKVGFLSSLVVSFVPGIFSFSRTYMPEF